MVCCAIFWSGGTTMRLKELREKQGITQQTVAKAIGCSPNTYSRYEREEREADNNTLKLLSKYFEVSIDYILCNDWEEK